MIELMLAAMLAVQSPAEAAKEKAEEAAAEVNIARVRRFAASLREAPSARERALGATMLLPLREEERRVDDALSGAVLRKAAEEARGNRLVQMLWAAARDEASGCDARNPCPGRREALARLEPENGFAWTPVLNAAAESGDANAVDAALVRMADASRFDDYFVEGFQAWLAAIQPRLHELGAGLNSQHAWTAAVSYTTVMAPGPSQPAQQCNLHRHPDASAVRLEACARIGRLMSRHGTSVMTQRLGLATLQGARIVENAEDLVVRRELDWMTANIGAVARKQESNPADMKQYFADLVATGSEQRTMELAMERHGIPAMPPAGWQAPARH